MLSSGSSQRLWWVWVYSEVKVCPQQSADRRCESYARHPSGELRGISPVNSSEYGLRQVYPDKEI